MGEIINLQSVEKEISEIKKSSKTTVLVGGCFDILHVGHIKFLKEAKGCGDVLLVLLESDEKASKLKGTNRPYFTQKDRSVVLSSISYVDFVLPLPFMASDDDYDKLIQKIKPDIIAATENDPILDKKNKQAKVTGGKLKIIPFVKTFSSSQLAKLLEVD